MLDQEDGLAAKILEKLDAKPADIDDDLVKYLQAQPKGSAVNVAKDEIQVSTKLMQVLEIAEQEAGRLKDQFISIEHLLIAVCDESKGQSGSILKKHGVTKERILKALTAIRGKQKVTSQDPEGTYQALERYGKDLTLMAHKGKTRPGYWP